MYTALAILATCWQTSTGQESNTPTCEPIIDRLAARRTQQLVDLSLTRFPPTRRTASIVWQELSGPCPRLSCIRAAAGDGAGGADGGDGGVRQVYRWQRDGPGAGAGVRLQLAPGAESFTCLRSSVALRSVYCIALRNNSAGFCYSAASASVLQHAWSCGKFCGKEGLSRQNLARTSSTSSGCPTLTRCIR